MPVSQGHSLAALCSRERRARFSVGVGCPSFGGERSVGGHFGFPPGRLVKKLKPWRYVTVQRCPSSLPELGVETATGSVLPSRRAAQTETAAVPVLHSQSSVSRVASPISSGSVRLARQVQHRWCIPVPNPSVKGTGLRPAPYVER
jgi:hypothetical protein